MRFVVVSSGSIGNCYAFYDGKDTLLVDAGVSFKRIADTLGEKKIPLSSVKYLFISHLHPDHTKGVSLLRRRLYVDIYISFLAFEKNKREIEERKMGKVWTFDYGEEVKCGSFNITAFQTSHDSEGSSGFFITNKESSVFLMSDTGVIPSEAESYAKKSNLKFIEANYDSNMLKNGFYSESLKRRVAGKYGHLSNSEAIEFAKKVSSAGDKVFFVHLSDNNNNETLVENLAKEKIGDNVYISALKRGESAEGVING